MICSEPGDTFLHCYNPNEKIYFTKSYPKRIRSRLRISVFLMKCGTALFSHELLGISGIVKDNAWNDWGYRVSYRGLVELSDCSGECEMVRYGRSILKWVIRQLNFNNMGFISQNNRVCVMRIL